MDKLFFKVHFIQIIHLLIMFDRITPLTLANVFDFWFDISI